MQQRDGMLTWLRDIGTRSKDGHIISQWLCACGNTVDVIKSRVIHGRTRSCGCLIKATKNVIHGKRSSPEYSSWQAMKGRCLNVLHKDFPRWGGTGVTICDTWRVSFEAFFADMGARPTGTTLDRINPNDGYHPGNVRWATPKQQARNRRDLVMVSTPKGAMALVDYAKQLGISKGAAHLRLKRGKMEGVFYV